jgi:hypothetical protein
MLALYKRLIALSTIVLLLGSCASGSVVLTGQARQPVSAAVVKLYTQAPAEYEVIGLVKASSEMGWTDQGSLNYAMEELKKQAGKLGANGVLIDSMGEKAGTSSGSFVPNPGGGGVFIYQSDSTQVVSGKAIYVTREK